MQLDRIKARTRSIAPGLSTHLLQPLWQAGRRHANKAYLKITHPEIVLLEVGRVTSGQFNQPDLIDFLLSGKRDGFFIDIGANHPSYNSNSYFFETERGYCGWAFDPLDKYADLWSQQRSRTTYRPLALGSVNGSVRFFEHANDDGWADQLSYTAVSPLADGNDRPGRSVPMSRLDELEGLPTEIDFVSLDVEGAELDVLQGFGSKIRPSILLVENCFGIAGNEAIRHFVIAMGYRFSARVTYVDDLFVRSDRLDILEKVNGIKAALGERFV
jgi:FkbM family methyltransferase